MKLEEIFEDMRPVATVWRKRGNKIERGRVSKFCVNLKPLSKIETDRGTEETEPNGVRRKNASGLSPQGGEGCL